MTVTILLLAIALTPKDLYCGDRTCSPDVLDEFGEDLVRADEDDFRDWRISTQADSVVCSAWRHYRQRRRRSLIGTIAITGPAFLFVLCTGFASDDPDFRMSPNFERAFYGVAIAGGLNAGFWMLGHLLLARSDEEKQIRIDFRGAHERN
jgi:hypothetical protein